MRGVSGVQVGEEGSAKSRARRWARVVNNNSFTWPEILRRYLLATRAKSGIPQAQLQLPDAGLSLLPDNVAAVKGALELGHKPWYRWGHWYPSMTKRIPRYAPDVLLQRAKWCDECDARQCNAV